MDGQGTLELTFIDTHDKPLNDTVNVTLQHTRLMTAGAKVRGFDGTKVLRINDLNSTEGGVYRMMVEASKYQTVSRSENIRDGKTTAETLKFPVNPAKVKKVDSQPTEC